MIGVRPFTAGRDRPGGGLEDYLSKLRQENEIMMTNYDTKIEDFRSKIDKATQQLQKLSSGLNKLVAEKQNKQKEFLDMLNDYVRLSKINKSKTNK